MRKVAAHWVNTPSATYRQAVVVLDDGVVVDVFPFTEELPSTEWLGGTIIVRADDNGILRAYHQEMKL